jgi:hypothetical protein
VDLGYFGSSSGSSVFSAVYTFIYTAEQRLFTLWSSVVHELEVVVGLAPLLFASLSSSWFSRVVATDASGLGQGVVASVADGESLLADRGVPLLSWVESTDWKTIVSSPWRDTADHINVLELRAIHTALRWVLSFPQSTACRCVVLSDSLVSVGALSKGRSSSSALLRRLRSVAALVLASGLQVYYLWIPSESNPADEPSRTS